MVEVCLLGRSGFIFIFLISAHSCCKTTILSQLTLGPLLKIPYTHTNVTVATSGRCFRSKRHPRRNPSINNGDMSQNVENDVRNGIGLQVSEIRKNRHIMHTISLKNENGKTISTTCLQHTNVSKVNAIKRA